MPVRTSISTRSERGFLQVILSAWLDPVSKRGDEVCDLVAAWSMLAYTLRLQPSNAQSEQHAHNGCRTTADWSLRWSNIRVDENGRVFTFELEPRLSLDQWLVSEAWKDGVFLEGSDHAHYPIPFTGLSTRPFADVSALLEAANVKNAILQLGSLLVVKRRGNLVARTMTPEETRDFAHDPDLPESYDRLLRSLDSPASRRK